MKNIRFGAIAACVLLAVSCSNDFDLTDKWKDIPVVYGFIDQADTAHYVRVEKAFLDPTVGAPKVAQIADSLYYDDALVFFEKKNGQRFQLQRVDGALEGYPRDSGIFAQTPNILYKIKRSAINLVPGDTLKIVVERGDNLPLVTGKTVVIGDIAINTPNIASTNIDVYPDKDFTFRWTPGLEAQIFDISGKIRIKETDLTTFEVKIVTLDWPIKRGVIRKIPTGSVNTEIPGSQFYKFIGENLPDTPNKQRSLFTLEFRVDAGGQEILDYNAVITANAGLSGAELIPVYTNLSEGYGIFTSRGYVVETGYKVGQATHDELKNGEATKHLNFK